MSEAADLGQRLRRIRESHNISFRDAAAASGVASTTLFRLESGQGTSYNHGKKIEAWLDTFKEPREWSLSENMVISGDDMVGNEVVEVIEIMRSR